MAKSFNSPQNLASANIVCDMGKSVKRKRRRLGKIDCESSTESRCSASHSNHVSDSGTSESEFEEHPYSVLKKSSTRMYSNEMSLNETSSKRSKHKPKLECRPSSSYTISKRSVCTSKNALMARINRIKKKEYIESLQARNAELEAENELLKEMLDRRMEEVSSLKRETVNLRNVIRNSTEIGSFLKCIHQNTNLQISSSLVDNIFTDSQPKCENLQTSAISHELSPNDQEGKDFVNILNNTSILTPDPLPNDDPNMFDFEVSHLLSDSENKVSRFDLPFDPIMSNKTESDISWFNADSFVRCETPSRGFDICVNKETLFDDFGICLNIANKKVSLEFCDMCNRKATL